MRNENEVRKAIPSLRDLYPNLDDNRLKEAEENLDRYIALALRIYERAQEEPQAGPESKPLTASLEMPTLNPEKVE